MFSSFDFPHKFLTMSGDCEYTNKFKFMCVLCLFIFDYLVIKANKKSGKFNNELTEMNKTNSHMVPTVHKHILLMLCTHKCFRKVISFSG